MSQETLEMQLYNKYNGLITVAFNEDIYQDKEGAYRCKAKRTQQRDKYLFKGFKPDGSDNIALIECPQDVLPIEFEKHSTGSKQDKKSSKQDRDGWIKQTRNNAEQLGLNACIVSHGGTSDYVYLFNLKGLPEGRENEAKKIVAKAVIPEEAQLFLDWSNLGKTLIPPINRDHWKKDKYKGAIHKVIGGKDPRQHVNDVSKLILEKLKPEEKREPKQNDLATEIKSQVSLKDVMSKLGFDLSKNPTDCLWHGSKSKKCFSYDDVTGLWHCFHCDRGGDLIGLVMEDKKLKFFQAAKWLKAEFGLNISLTSKKNEKGEEESEEETQADTILKLALDNSNLFHDQYNEPFACIEAGNHKEIHGVNSKFFKRWLSKLFYELKEKVPNSNSMASALKVIEAKGCFDGEKKELHNRVAWHEGSIYYDLTDALWRAVKIDEKGWEIVNDPPILFRRYSHQAAQTLPKEAGDYDKIARYYNIRNKDNLQLMKVYNISCMIPGIPHPIPTLHGPQGSAKSTAFKVSRKLIDPSVIEVLGAPKENKEVVQMLSHHYCSYFDNLSIIPGWLSDMFCKAVTGDGFSKRQLFTDDDDIIYTFKRCIGINGINVAATKPDLLDRAMLMGFDEVNKKARIPERRFWPSFEKDRATMLGGAFDILSYAMRIKKEIVLQELPRMADFAEWGEAISRSLGYDPNSFIDNYFGNVAQQNEEAIQAHVIGPAVMELLKTGNFEGTPAALLERLEGIAGSLKINTKARGWPKAPHILTRRLKEIKSNLGNMGITVIFDRGTERIIRILYNMREATVVTEATVTEEEVIEENDAKDSNDAIFAILNTSDLIAYIKGHQLDNEKGADIQTLSDYSKNPKVDDLIAEAKSKGEIAEFNPGFLKLVE